MNIVEMIPNHLYIEGESKNSNLEIIYNHIIAIINLRAEPDFLPFNFYYIVMIWTLLTIFSTPEVIWMIRMSKLISNLIDSKHIAFLHDKIGIQRLGFVITAFYMYHFNLTRDQDLSVVRPKKPNINPPKNYINLLSEFETTL